jgi:cytochrome c oxidase subunit II
VQTVLLPFGCPLGPDVEEEDVPVKRWLRRAFGLTLLGVVLTGCGVTGPLSTFDAHGPMAAMKNDIFWLTFWLGIVVLAGVFGVLFYCVYRFRAREGDRRLPEQIHGNLTFEVAWTILPAVLIVIIAIPTVQAIWAIQTRQVDPDALEINVIGYQWWWAFEYPELGITTANEVHIPVGRTVNFNVRSGDVIHSFWVPKLSGKMDLIPNQDNQLWFSADVPGVYYGHCTEYCLGAHAQMRLRLIAQDEDDFNRWVEGFGEAAEAEPPVDELVQLGSELFLQRGCVQCHAIAGTGGDIGPDLTNFGQRLTLAAGIVDNTAENLAAWLRDPQAVKPENHMPTIPLTEEDIDALVAYLLSLGMNQEMITGGQ